VQHQHVLCYIIQSCLSNSILSTWIRNVKCNMEATMVQLYLQPCDSPVISVVPKGG
jgi:hypothetical protein